MADYIVTGPDGKKYKMSADSPEALDHAVGQMFGGASAPAPTATGSQGGPSVEPPPGASPVPAEPSLVDRIMSGGKSVLGVADQGVRGLVEGAANVLGLPGDIAAAIGGRSGKSGVAFLPGGLPAVTSDTIKAIPNKLNDWTADLLGVERPRQQPEGFAEHLANRVGQEVGAAAVPVGGAVATGVRLGVPAARTAIPAATGRKIVDFIRQAPAKMVESAAVNPGRFVAKEGTGAVAAGTGATVANEYVTGKNATEAAGQAPTTGQKVGDLIGALTGYTVSSVGGKIKDVGKHVIDAFRGDGKQATQVARDVAVDDIARAAGLTPGPRGAVDTDPLIAAINSADKSAVETVPGLKPTLADTTKNEGLAGLEYSRQSGPNSGLYTKQRNDNVGAVDSAMNRSAPDGQPGAFKSALEVERDARIGAASTAAAEAETAAATAVAPVTPHPNATRAGRGDTIRGEVDTARDVARQGTRDAYEAADVNNVPLNPTFLAEGLDRTTQGLSQAERTFVPQGLIDRIAQMPAGEPATLREATSLRTVLVDQQRAALGDPDRRYEARVLGQYIEAVEDVIGQSVSAEQRGALEAARGARRAEAEAFERRGDPVAQITARHPGGVPKMRDENVARAATRDDVIGRLFDEADTPATRAAIRDELLTNADTTSAAGIQRFQEQYGEQIARFPGLRDELNTAAQARIREGTARGTLQGLQDDIGRDGRGRVAEYLRYGNENAERAMRAVLADKDPAKAIDELLNFAGNDPAAVEGARKVAWDILQKDTKSAGSSTGTVRDNVQPYLPARLKAFLDDPAKGAVLERLYRDNPEHLENIRKVTEAMQGMDVRTRAKALNSSGTPQGILPTGETVASRAFAVQRGVVSPTFAAINIAGIIARKAIARTQDKLINRITDEMLLNPEFAAQLLKENNPANRAALARGARGWLGNEASSFVKLLGPDDPDEDVKRAVGR